MELRKFYEEKVEAQLKELSVKYTFLKDDLKRSLQAKREKAEGLLRELKSSSHDTWGGLKTKLEDAVREFRSGVKRADESSAKATSATSQKND